MATLNTEADKIRALATVAALAGLLGNDPTWIIPKKEEPPLPLLTNTPKEKKVVAVLSCPDFGHVDDHAEEKTERRPSDLVQPDSVLAWSVDLGRRKRHGKLSDDSFPDDEPERHSSPSSVTLLDQAVIDKLHRGTALPLIHNDSKKKMRFREKVSIVHIPSHRDVDPEIAKKVWTSPDEVHANLERNAWEFNAVGRDWTKVLEEDQMIFDPISGEYIHPATWELMEIQRQEELRDQELRRLAQAEKERRARFAMEQQQQQQQQQQQNNKPQGSPSKNKIRRRQTGRPVVADEQSPKSPTKPRSPKEARRRRKAASLSPPRKCSSSSSQSSSTTTKQQRSQRSSSVGGSRRKPRAMANAGALTRFADT